jgi:hypothetical protein
MSIESFEPIPEQPEDVSGRVVGTALVVIVGTIVLCTLVVWAYMRFDADGGGRSAEVQPALIPPATTFSSETPLEKARAAQRARLESWSWADREHHLVRLPVEAAIDRYVGGRR